MSEFLITEVRGHVGFITLNRPKALNALNLDMVRGLTATLLAWERDPAIAAVAIRGTNKLGNFGSFCAGGDIRFFHQAALAGNPALEDFFTEEYALNHLIHHYPKPYIPFMDGIVMGGGMGISQGTRFRLVTENTKMAMPETHIGLFPDVGGGYFLSRCPGSTGEWLALTGATLNAAGAMELGLADYCLNAASLTAAWAALGAVDFDHAQGLSAWLAEFSVAPATASGVEREAIDRVFSLATAVEMVSALEAAPDAWSQQTAATLRHRSPLMLHVVLEQVRRARSMGLADDLRMERDMVRHCFHTAHLARSGVASETVEGIRALAVDKDQQPRWNPARVEDVTPEMVAPFFDSPWPASAHPLRQLA
ncbi:MAG: enoyl-CoA hydratase/isomerase family protein [Betaproteobacteria bacterium]